MRRIWNLIQKVLNKLHLSEGAAAALVLLFGFGVGIHKIENRNIDKVQTFQKSACKLLDGSNRTVTQSRERIESSRKRSLRAAKAEQAVADVWLTAIKDSPTPVPGATLKLINRLIHAQENLALQDREAAADLQRQADAVQPIVIQGC